MNVLYLNVLSVFDLIRLLSTDIRTLRNGPPLINWL